MSEKNIHKKSWAYQLLFAVGSMFHRIYYRKICVIGKEHIPHQSPIIFVSNHQNALMDALSILFTSRKQVVFLARADIFKKRWVSRLLYFLKMLPVYRFRDGIENMGENDKTFLRALEILRYRTPLALFPEGNHGDQKKLRTMKKGVCRIAFQSEELANFELGIHIVPIGIDYSRWQYRNDDLLVQFGKPIDVAEFIPLYKENPAKAMNELLHAIARGIQPLMIDIQQDSELYPTYFEIIKLFRNQYFETKICDTSSRYQNFLAQKELIQKLDTQFEAKTLLSAELKDAVNQYQAQLKKSKLPDEAIGKFSFRFFGALCVSLILFPTYFAGLILNYIPYKTPYFLIRNAKDPLFHPSLNFAVWFLSSLLYYPFIAALLFAIFPSCQAWWSLAAIAGGGLFAVFYARYFTRALQSIRFIWMKIRNPEMHQSLLSLKENILSKIQKIMHG